MQNRVLNGVQQPVQVRLAGLQVQAVLLEGRQQVKVRVVELGLDGLQAQPQLTQEQDLLQAQQGQAAVLAIAVPGVAGRLEQANLIVVVQGASAHTRQPGQLFDGEMHFRNHAAILNYDVTLMSRGKIDFLRKLKKAGLMGSIKQVSSRYSR